MKKKKIIFIPGIFDIQYECRPFYNVISEMGFEVVIFHYTSWGRESFFSVERKLEKFIVKHKPVGIIGYSHGGALAIGARHNLPILSVGGTIHGTTSGYLWQTIGFQQIRFGSQYLQHISGMIAQRQRKIRQNNKIISIYTPFDLIIIPFTSSKVGQANLVLAPLHQLLCFSAKSKLILKNYLHALK